MVSIISIIGIFPIVILFTICFGLTLRSYLKNPNRAKIFFMGWAIAVVCIYLTWGIRVLIIPQFETDTKVLYPFWALAYALGGSSMVALDFATIEMSEIKKSTYKKYIIIIILVTWISTFVILFIGFEVALITFMDVSDLMISNSFVYFYFTILILFYLFFPNAIFIRFLIKSHDKTEFIYKRIRIIELGILLFSIGIALDGMRFPSNLGIFIARLIIMIGGILMVKGLLMKSAEK